MSSKRGAVFFDCDGTLFRDHLVVLWLKELIRMKHLPEDALAECVGAYERFLHRQETFDAYANAVIRILFNDIVNLHAGEARAAGVRVVKKHGTRVHVFPRELCASARENEFSVFAISGSPLDVVQPFADLYGMHGALGTTFHQTMDCYVGGIVLDWIKDSGKGRAVDHFTSACEIDLAKSVAIGDTTGDVSMLEKVGYPMCFNPNRELLAVAKERRWPFVVERKDVCYIHAWSEEREAYHLVDVMDGILPEGLSAAFQSRYRAHFG
jgi:HAD superfamily hydrolase (TIGR01490 family)